MEGLQTLQYRMRTQAQNNYYWKCIVKILSSELGYFQYEMHNILKKQFSPINTKDMNTQEFNDYCEMIRIWALTDLGIVIPPPNKNK